jgi:hypothetical protein
MGKQQLWSDYQSKQLRETEVYVVSDDQKLLTPTTIVGQVESGRSIFVPRILNDHHSTLKFHFGLCLLLSAGLTVQVKHMQENLCHKFLSEFLLILCSD